jgi:hypothetical protein
MAARPNKQSAPQRPRSKAAQATAAARAARTRAAAAEDAWEDEAEAHPDAIRFEGKGKVDAGLYDRVLAGPDDAAKRRMWRNAGLMAVVVLIPTVWFLSRVLASG